MSIATRSRSLIGSIIVSSTLVTVVHARAGEVPNLAASSTDSCLVLEWMDPHDLLPVGERWMAKETLRVLGAADVEARWDWSRDERDEREHRLRVVLVPSEPSGPGWGLPPNTLGATLADGVNAPPAVYIFYKTIAQSFELEKRPRTSSYFLARASRALGRVVAHEIAHAIAPGVPHAREGLMQADPHADLFLAKGDVVIDARWRDVLARGISRLCSER